MEETKFYYCLLSNIPSTFHASDLRNFFAVFIEAEKFNLFHFRHRPQIMAAPEDDSNKNENKSLEEIGGASNNCQAAATQLKKFCCIIRFNDNNTLNEFIRKYHRKYWLDKLGNEFNSRCLVSEVDLTSEDLQKFSTKELRPPSIMPK